MTYSSVAPPVNCVDAPRPLLVPDWLPSNAASVSRLWPVSLTGCPSTPWRSTASPASLPWRLTRRQGRGLDWPLPCAIQPWPSTVTRPVTLVTATSWPRRPSRRPRRPSRTLHSRTVSASSVSLAPKRRSGRLRSCWLTSTQASSASRRRPITSSTTTRFAHSLHPHWWLFRPHTTTTDPARRRRSRRRRLHSWSRGPAKRFPPPPPPPSCPPPPPPPPPRPPTPPNFCLEFLMLLENPVQWIGIGSMFRFIVAFLLKTIKFLFFFFYIFLRFHWNGAQCAVTSSLYMYCKYRHNIIIFVYLACQCTVNSSFPKCTYLLRLFKPSFWLFSNSKLEICVSDHYIVFSKSNQLPVFWFFFIFFTPFISFILYISFQWCRGFCYLIVYNNRPAVRYHWISAATLFQRLISFPLRWDSNFCIQDGAAQTEVISRQEISVGSVVMVVGPNEKSERPSKLQSAPLTNYGRVITTFFFKSDGGK